MGDLRLFNSGLEMSSGPLLFLLGNVYIRHMALCNLEMSVAFAKKWVTFLQNISMSTSNALQSCCLLLRRVGQYLF